MNSDNIQATKEEKFLLLFEAAKRSLILADLFVTNLKDQLKSFEHLIDASNLSGDKIAISLFSAMSFVDSAHRFYSVIDSIPYLNKKTVKIRTLREKMKCVEDVRNYLQHMRNDLSSNQGIIFSIFGSLSWISSGSCYTISLSQPGKSECKSIQYDTFERKWATTYQYEVNGQLIFLEEIVEEMKKSYEYISGLVEFSDPDFSKLSWGQSIAINVKPFHY